GSRFNANGWGCCFGLNLNEKPVIDRPVLCCSTLTFMSVCSLICLIAGSKTRFLKSHIALYSFSFKPTCERKSLSSMTGVLPVLRQHINNSYKRVAYRFRLAT